MCGSLQLSFSRFFYCLHVPRFGHFGGKVKGMEGDVDGDAPAAAPTLNEVPSSPAQIPENAFLEYCRYYIGHTGRHGHEFLEFELRGDGTLKYANGSSYRRDTLLKKQVCVSQPVLHQIRHLILQSNVLNLDDAKWPEPDRGGRQELEIVMGSCHISFATNKCSMMAEIMKAQDPEGLAAFFYLVQDLKSLILSLVSIHFKIKPTPV